MSITITLTRDEAAAIDSELDWTVTGLRIDEATDTHDDCHRVIRRLSLEAAIRDGGGEVWWSHDSPYALRSNAEFDGSDCPDAFPMSHDGAGALADFLDEHLACILDELEDELGREVDAPSARWRKNALVGLAARLGVEIPAREAVS